MTTPTYSWSNRRAAVAAETQAEARAVEEAEIAQQQAELESKTDADVLEELGLPDPDSLKMGDDFKAFMSKAVPERLRKRALRKLWRSNPVLACVDGLNDYDDDYLTGSTGNGPIKTGYQVGKGMLAHLLEVERQKDAKTPGVATTEIDANDEDADDVVPVEDADVVEAAPEHADPEPADHSEIEAPAPRRMQFQFKDEIA